MSWHWITPPITWAKAVPLPTNATSTTTMAIIIAILVRTSSSLALEKGIVSALPPSRCHRHAHINNSIWGATHPQTHCYFLHLFTEVPGECPGSQQARATENSRHSRDRRRNLLRPKDSRKLALDLLWGGIMSFLVVGKACL